MGALPTSISNHEPKSLKKILLFTKKGKNTNRCWLSIHRSTSWDRRYYNSPISFVCLFYPLFPMEILSLKACSSFLQLKSNSTSNRRSVDHFSIDELSLDLRRRAIDGGDMNIHLTADCTYSSYDQHRVRISLIIFLACYGQPIRPKIFHNAKTEA